MAGLEDVRSVQTGDAGRGAGKAKDGTASSFYKAHATLRDPYLQRARRCAGLTMPSLFPADQSSNAQPTGADEVLPWNSIGAYLVANLAAKVGKSMFPVGLPPMKLRMNRASRRDITAMEQTDPAGAQKILTGIDVGLSVVEQEFSEEMEADGDRAHLSIAILKMICGGNHAIQFKPDGTLRGISLERFVTQRDPGGALLRWAIEDPMAWLALDPDVKEIALRNGYNVDPSSASQPEVCIYTHGQIEGKRWRIHQETYGEVIPGTEALLDPDAVGYLFLPWQLLPGEHFGRSYCENYEADLDLVDGLTKTVAQGAAAIARFILLVSPTGLTNKKQVAQADNGDVITGRADDVHALTSEKSGDLAIAKDTAQETAQRLARAFLVTSAVVRQAERVTAEEVVRLAQELEEVLGSVYSEQVVTFQTPYVKRKLGVLVKANRITRLPLNTVDPKVIGGAAALGRNAELTRLDQFLGGALQTIGPQLVIRRLNDGEYLSRRAAALGIEPEGLIKSDDEVAQADAQAQQQALSQQATPALINQYGQYRTATDTAQINADTKLATAAAPAVPAIAPPPAQQ